MLCQMLEKVNNIGQLWNFRAVIDMNPPYQRESGVWSLANRQLFIDSLLNGYDIPKLYFQDFRGGRGKHQFAVVDGKQRLESIWAFRGGEFQLGDGISGIDGSILKLLGEKKGPEPGMSYSDMPNVWQDYFGNISLPIVALRDASEEDIEDLFLRLNSGESLKGPEKRNAMGGKMCNLIQKFARDEFFGQWTSFPMGRMQHYDMAAKFLRMEKARQDGSAIFCDLKKRMLDDMVVDNRNMPENKRKKLREGTDKNVKLLKRVFKRKDPMLKRPTYVPLCYAFCVQMTENYGHARLFTMIREFLPKFEVRRVMNLKKSEDVRDGLLSEFSRLMGQGNDKESMGRRVDILTRFFLRDFPSVEILDKKRAFSETERIVIFLLGKGKCAHCGSDIKLQEMHADHRKQRAHGGKTTLKNAQSLCAECNAKKNQRRQ